MMMIQELAFLKAQWQLRGIEQFVEQAAIDGQRIDMVERGLMARLLELGRTMLAGLVAAQGDGDAGKELPAGEHTVRHLDEARTRRYLSIFGELRIRRYVYAVRAGQKIERRNHRHLNQPIHQPARKRCHQRGRRLFAGRGGRRRQQCRDLSFPVPNPVSGHRPGAGSSRANGLQRNVDCNVRSDRLHSVVIHRVWNLEHDR
jgi:hypothetical protein